MALSKVVRRMKFSIMGTLPGLNEIIGAARSHWAASSKQKRAATDLCRFWVNAARLTPVSRPVKIHFDWYEPTRRRDPDNLRAGSKFLLDSLVEAGILPNDSRKWIVALSDTFHEADKANPRIEVTIEEAA